MRLDPPGLAEYFLEHATDTQLAHVPPVALYEAETVDGRIRISAESDTRSMRKIEPRRQAALDRARDPIRKAASKKRWVLTQYPTQAYADDARMPREDYERYVAAAMFLDRPNPVAAWQELGQRQAGLIDFLSSVKTLRIEGDGTDLTLSVEGRTWINSDGRRNMPSGEVFTGPIETTLRGGSVAASRSAGAGGRSPGSPWILKKGRSSRPAPRRERNICSRCSISTPVPDGSASWASA